jgi:anti-sigma factor ChrR (cupin superfamily)
MSSASPRPACGRFDDVYLYAVGALPDSEITGIQAHLAECASCRDELDALGPVLDSFVAWPRDVLRPSKPLWDRVAERIGAETGERPAAPAAREWREPDWEEVAPGILTKLLAADHENDRVSMLVRLAPGVAYPPHKHAGVEELHLLDGVLIVDEKTLYPGDYIYGEPGTTDALVWSETGCTCVLITSTRDELR